VRRISGPPRGGRLERRVAGGAGFGACLIRQRLAGGVIAVLCALAGHRQAEGGAERRGRVDERRPLGFEQMARLVRLLRPHRQEPGQHHRRVDALDGRVRRRQGEHLAQHVAGLGGPPRRGERARPCSQQRQAARPLLGGLG
jgi:hypothetical protein